jgi:hypothetical protein
LRIVERFARNTAAQLEKFGDSAPNIVQRFIKLRESNPGLTAEEYLGPKAVARFASTDPVVPGGRIERAKLVATLKAAMPGVAKATLDALNDDQLLDLLKNLPSPL